MTPRGSGSQSNFSPLILVALACCGSAAGCRPPAAEQSDHVRPVKTLVVTAGDGLQTRAFPGRAEAARRADLAFQVSGLLTRLPVKEGQEVAEGEVIAQLRQDEFEARLKTLQGQLDQARAALRALRAGERPEERLRREAQVRAALARLENARIEHDRNTRLLQTRAIPRSEFDLSETAYRVAQEDYAAAVQLLEKGTIGREEDIEAREAEVRGLEGRVVEARLNVSDATLRAPFAGVIARRLVDENQNVQAKQPIVEFQDIEEIDVVVDVPEVVMSADLRTADIVSLTAEFSGAPGVQFPVRIREIAQVADPTTQTFQIRVAMPAPTEVRVLPGMTATVTATYRRASILGDPILVPVSAIQRTAAGKQVAWIVSPDLTVSSRSVQVGQAEGGEIAVLEGLAPGDRIAVAGVSFLRDGMRIRDLAGELGGSLP